MNPSSRFQVDPDISLARTLHTDFYKDPAVWEWCRRELFPATWQFLRYLPDTTSGNNVYPLTLGKDFLDEPLVITRDAQQQLHCLSNVCTHRGNPVAWEACRASQLRCRYHGRLFQLDGTFKSMPEFQEVQDFPSASDNLHSLPLKSWGPLLFTRLAGDKDWERFMGDMQQRLHWLPLEEFRYREDLSREFHVKAHWALYCENYLEGFHIPFVHAGLNAVIDFGDYTTETYTFSNLQLGMAREGELVFDLPSSSADYGKRVAAYYYWVFPNLMFNFYPWGLSLNVVEPVSPELTRVRFLTYVWKEALLGSGAGAGLDTVEMEDEEVVEMVQKGVKSRFYSHGRYSVNREQGTHHFHRILSQLLTNAGI